MNTLSRSLLNAVRRKNNLKFVSQIHKFHDMMTSSTDTAYATAGCEQSDPLTGAVVPSIHLSTTYERSKETLELTGGFNYSRLGNPTRLLLENTFAKLENGVAGFAFSSGMQACTTLLMACPNSHVILPDDLYHGVFAIASEIFALWGLTYEKVDMTNHSLVTEKLKECQLKGSKKVVLWMETPSNPQCKVTDIQGLSQIAKTIILEENLCIVVDATWTTPYITKPLDFGADIVLHSTTKYVGGHSDVLAGMLVAGKTVGAAAVLQRLKVAHEIGGGVSSPFDSYLVLRGLRSLPVRMKQHCTNAMQVALFLENHPGVERVYYPGLESHPQHDLAKVQMKGMFGGMVSLLVRSSTGGDGMKESLQVVKSVKLFKRATSLGGTESLIEHRASVEGAFRVSSLNLLRLSIGLEDAADLIADLDEALRLAKEN